MIRQAALLAILSTASAAPANDVLEVRLSRHVMSAPGALRITAFVEQHDDHRSLTSEVDSPSFFRSSTIQLDGATDPRTHFGLYRDLPEGEYQIRVAVRGINPILAASHQMTEAHGESTASVRSHS